MRRTPAIALASALIVAGCGSDETDPVDEYIAEGDRICALGTFQIGSEAQTRYGSPQPPPRRVEEFSSGVVVPTLRTEVLEKLRALTPPEGDERQVGAIYGALENGIDALKADPGLLAEANTGGAFDEANRLAQAYGFAQCGQG